MKISAIKPIRPIKKYAKKIIALPYDVFDYDEAKNEIEKNKNSFLKISRSDATFKNIKDPYNDSVYERAKKNLNEMIENNMLIKDSELSLFLWEITFKGKKQAGIVAGFDQDEYMSAVNANKRSKASLIEEYKNVRKATISLLGSLDKEALSNIGTASQSNLSPRAAGFIIIGHEIHHSDVIVERYLK